MFVVKDNKVSYRGMTRSWSDHNLGDDAMSYLDNLRSGASLSGVLRYSYCALKQHNASLI